MSAICVYRLTLDEFREGSKADPRIVQALSLGDT